MEYSSSQSAATSLTATRTRMPYGIAQCYLPPGRDDNPALTATEAGTGFNDAGGRKAELTLS